MCSRSNLQKHFFVLGVIRIIGFSAQFFHVCDKVSVANYLQKASLKRDSQPKVFKNRRNTHEEKQNIHFGISSLDGCTIGLFHIYIILRKLLIRDVFNQSPVSLFFLWTQIHIQFTQKNKECYFSCIGLTTTSYLSGGGIVSY